MIHLNTQVHKIFEFLLACAPNPLDFCLLHTPYSSNAPEALCTFLAELLQNGHLFSPFSSIHYELRVLQLWFLKVVVGGPADLWSEVTQIAHHHLFLLFIWLVTGVMSLAGCWFVRQSMIVHWFFNIISTFRERLSTSCITKASKFGRLSGCACPSNRTGKVVMEWNTCWKTWSHRSRTHGIRLPGKIKRAIIKGETTPRKRERI